MSLVADERVHARALRVLDDLGRALDVRGVRSGEARDDRAVHLPRDRLYQAWKSPGEAIGNPASITSTPRRASWWAISSFSCGVEG